MFYFWTLTNKCPAVENRKRSHMLTWPAQSKNSNDKYHRVMFGGRTYYLSNPSGHASARCLCDVQCRTGRLEAGRSRRASTKGAISHLLREVSNFNIVSIHDGSYTAHTQGLVFFSYLACISAIVSRDMLSPTR